MRLPSPGWALTLLAASGEPAWLAPRVPAGAPPPAGLARMRAADCGACHTEIYAEWRSSIHAHAWTDRQFQGELAKDPEVAWLCWNCHTPAGDQQPQRVAANGSPRAPARAPNPSFDPDLQQEGVTCVTCHYREGALVGRHGDGPAPHAVVADAPALLEAGLCLGCHQAEARLEPALVCAFETGEEWREAGAERPCQACHMPEVTRPVATGGPPREGRRHLFLGSLIPKEGDGADLEALAAGFPSALRARVELPPGLTPGAEVEATLVIANQGADHALPTGDPERYLLVEVEVLDARGARVSRHTLRLGQRWLWWPEARRVADNRLRPGEERRLPLTLTLPEGGSLRLRASHHRISPENAAWHGLEGYPTHRVLLDETLPLVFASPGG